MIHKFRISDEDDRVYEWLMASGIPSQVWTYSKSMSFDQGLVSLYIHDEELATMLRLAWSDRISHFTEVKRHVK